MKNFKLIMCGVIVLVILAAAAYNYISSDDTIPAANVPSPSPQRSQPSKDDRLKNLRRN